MTERLAVFRASASPEIGGGHIVRCMALARALTTKGWRCVFASGTETAMTLPGIAEFDVLTLDEGNPQGEPRQIREKLGVNAAMLILDHYERNESFETQCRSWANHIVVIDDIPNRRHDANLLLDQSGGRVVSDYEGLVPANCLVLTGPRYSLLRDSFKNMASNIPGIIPKPPHRIFVSMGATDETDLTSLALRAVDASGIDCLTDVMLSARAPHLPKVEDLSKQLGFCKLHVDVSDPARIIAQAVVSIGTAGINLWERCALGVPSIIVVAAGNQKANAEYVANEGGGIIAGGATRQALMESLKAELAAILRHPDRLASMSSSAMDICDGLGADRVAEAIERLYL